MMLSSFFQPDGLSLAAHTSVWNFSASAGVVTWSFGVVENAIAPSPGPSGKLITQWSQQVVFEKPVTPGTLCG